MNRHNHKPVVVAFLALTAHLGCGDGPSEATQVAIGTDVAAKPSPPERASEHYILPEESCVDSSWCFWDANGGCVPPGERFLDYGHCPTVRTQGPPGTRPARSVAGAELRLHRADFAREFAWITEQVEASACMCCHDSDSGAARVFDVSQGPFWISAMTNRGLMMAAGIVNTDVLGAFAPESNHGFDRYSTIFPTTDTERFRDFFLAELDHRAVTQNEIDSVRPLGGPLTSNAENETEPCAPGVGVDARGVIHWTKGEVRYAWILEPDADNPGVPPNLDIPRGTLWYAAVHHEDEALSSGRVNYSSTPPGARQLHPSASEAPPNLVNGTPYKLFLLPDHGHFLLENCTFHYPIEV